MEKSSRRPKVLDGCASGTSELGIDRISHLPDDVIHKILSRLIIFDVFQLSVLSRKWNLIWRTMPYLDFYFSCYREWGPVDNLRDFINWVLISQCTATTLVRFKLRSGKLFDKLAIFRWILAATMRNVQQLVLSFECPDDQFELPHCVATCESLQVLELNLHVAELKLPTHLGFRRLKKLCLGDVRFSDERLTSRLFSKCPLLEELVLLSCDLGDMTVLDISSTSLVRLYIKTDWYCSSDYYSGCNIKISCPNLKILKYRALVANDIILENLFSIEVVHVFFQNDLTEEIGMLVHKMIKNVSSTSVLKLCFCSMNGLYYSTLQEVGNSLFTFHNLKSLKLAVAVAEEFIEVMILLLKHSPNLEVLNLQSEGDPFWSDDWDLQDPSESIVCLESHLKLIKLTDFRGEESERELLRFFLKNARVLKRLIIVWGYHYGVEKEKEASEVVLQYPRTSPHVVVTLRH